MILEIHMVENNVVMDMTLIHMSSDYILMFMISEAPGKLYSYLMCLLRSDLYLGK